MAGEDRRVYEEFGSCVLLFWAFVRRYSIVDAEVGLRQGSSFLSQWKTQISKPVMYSTMSNKQHQHLEKWLKGLFETHSVTDGLLSSCSKEEFYLLSPALFHQIVLSQRSNMLDGEALKRGVECRSTI